MQNTHDIISELRQARATQKKQSTLTIKQQCNPENSKRISETDSMVKVKSEK